MIEIEFLDDNDEVVYTCAGTKEFLEKILSDNDFQVDNIDVDRGAGI